MTKSPVRVERLPSGEIKGATIRTWSPILTFNFSARVAPIPSAPTPACALPPGDPASRLRFAAGGRRLLGQQPAQVARAQVGVPFFLDQRIVGFDAECYHAADPTPRGQHSFTVNEGVGPIHARDGPHPRFHFRILR